MEAPSGNGRDGGTEDFDPLDVGWSSVHSGYMGQKVLVAGWVALSGI